MPEEKRKINCLIPASMYDKIEASDYRNTTEAINAALEHLMNDNQDDIKCYIDEIEEYKQSIEGYKHEIEGYKHSMEEVQRQIRDLENATQGKSVEILRLQSVIQEAPDPVEFAQLCARYEEIEKHNSTLKADLEKASQDKEDLKQMHKNYFLQVQTLINQKAIEAPGNKKKWYKFW